MRNVYVREDVLLGWLAEHLASDPRRPGDGAERSAAEPSAVDEAVVWLRAQSTVIVCGGADWTLAPS